MKLAIVAGGRGTRLGFKDIPKPMVRIGGKPLLEHQINNAGRYGVREIYMLSGHLSDVIEDYFGNGSAFDVRITHIKERSPLGTAGAVRQLEDIINDRFMVFYGDVIFDIDLASFVEFDRTGPSIATIMVHPNDHPYDSDLVEVDEENFVTDFHSKPHDINAYYRNLVNAAVYILDPAIFRYIRDSEPSDFGKDVFPMLLKEEEKIRAYNTAEYIKDIGTPERLRKVEADLIKGKIAGANREKRKKAIFLDRDGVINKEVDNLSRAEDFELIEGAGEAVRKINKSGYLAVVITNQPAVAKGFCTEAGLNEIHKKMDTLLGYEGAYINGLYYCPHHPEKGFGGEVAELKIDCDCRKPKPGLILKAAHDHNIDLGGSFAVGDRYTDLKAGNDAGLKTVLVKTGHGGSDKDRYPDVTPDFLFDTLKEAVNFIVEQK